MASCWVVRENLLTIVPCDETGEYCIWRSFPASVHCLWHKKEDIYTEDKMQSDMYENVNRIVLPSEEPEDDVHTASNNKATWTGFFLL